jgi:hypothetical protein
MGMRGLDRTTERKGMKNALLIGMAMLALGLAGCAGPRGDSQPFHDVDLGSDLDADTLSRYRSEWERMSASGRGDAMTRLEYTNRWLLGFLGYWRRGGVMRSPSPDGVQYDVSRTIGFGPFASIYGATTHAAFEEDGKRVSWMSGGNLLWGHLAMFHRSDVQLPDGRRRKATSLHLLHHLIYVHRVNGRTYVSLFSLPNPVGADLPASGK